MIAVTEAVGIVYEIYAERTFGAAVLESFRKQYTAEK